MTAEKFARNLVLFLAFSITTAALSHAVFPFPASSFVKGRLDYLESHSPGFDVAFLGSSATLRGVDPAKFDEAVERRCGGRTHSVNLGMRGADGSGMDTLFRELPRRAADSLRWVIFETRTWNERIEPLDKSDQRAIWLHTMRNTYDWVLDVAALSLPLSTRVVLIRDHLLHMLARYLRIGQGTAIIRSWFEEPRSIAMPHRGAQLMALESLASSNERERRDRLLREPKVFVREVAQLAATSRDEAELSPRERARFENRLAMAREESLATLHFLVPNANARARSLRGKSESLGELIPDLVILDDPESHPGLFAIDNRWDRVHLNKRGAELLSTALAGAFCERFESDLR